MEVHLSAEQETKLRNTAARSGRDAQEIMTLALERFLADEERTLEEIRTAIDDGDADIEAGLYIDYNEDTLHQLFDDIRRRGTEALAAKRKTST